MLAALLLNPSIPETPPPIPETPPSISASGGGGYRRRPNEKVVWHDDWLKAQEKLTEFKALPEQEQETVAEQAIEAVKASVSDAPAVVDARQALEDYDAATDALLQLEYLNSLLLAYFMLRLERRREEDVAAMLMLGIL